MKIPALTEQHLQAHVSFGKLTRKISGDIQVSPCDRSMPGREACKKYEEMFVALMDIAPPVSRRTEARFSSRSDVKKLNMVVPPLIKMGIVKTFTQLEAERMKAAAKAKAMMEAEIAKASQPPKLRRGISTRFGDKRTRVSPSVQIEMPSIPSSANNVLGQMPGQLPRVTEVKEDNGLRVMRQGKKKQKRELRNELSSIAQVGRVTRLASTGGMMLEKDSSSSSDSESGSEIERAASTSVSAASAAVAKEESQEPSA